MNEKVAEFSEEVFKKAMHMVTKDTFMPHALIVTNEKSVLLSMEMFYKYPDPKGMFLETLHKAAFEIGAEAIIIIAETIIYNFVGKGNDLAAILTKYKTIKQIPDSKSVLMSITIGQDGEQQIKGVEIKRSDDEIALEDNGIIPKQFTTQYIIPPWGNPSNKTVH